MRTMMIRCLMGVCAFSLAVPVVAQEENPPPDPNWTGSLGLAYLATSGNTDTRTFGLDFAMARKPTPWGLEITAAFNRAEENSVTTAERYLVGGRARRALGDRLELFAGLSGEKDEFSGFDMRTVVETGVTYKALLGPSHLLSFDVGLTWTDEDRTVPEPDVSYVGGVAGLAYEWKMSDNASLTERFLYYPNFDVTSDWRMSSETALQASLTNRLALKLGYEVRYRHQPIGDNEDTDTATKVSVVAKF
jgi:putative salt-induced outer membrane protein